MNPAPDAPVVLLFRRMRPGQVIRIWENRAVLKQPASGIGK